MIQKNYMNAEESIKALNIKQCLRTYTYKTFINYTLIIETNELKIIHIYKMNHFMI
jgi:hypothetical protein